MRPQQAGTWQHALLEGKLRERLLEIPVVRVGRWGRKHAIEKVEQVTGRASSLRSAALDLDAGAGATQIV